MRCINQLFNDLKLLNMLPVLDALDKYSRMGDVGVLALCCLIFIMLACSYVKRGTSYRIFSAIIGTIFLAAICNVGYHELLRAYQPGYKYAIYTLRILYNTLLFDAFFLYTLYATIISNLKHSKAKAVSIVSSIMFVVFVAIDIILTFTNVGFSIGEDGVASQGFNVFMVGYVAYVIFLAVLIAKIRNLVYKRVVTGFYMTMTLAVTIRVAQMFLHDSSLTTFAFLLPALAMLYFMHLNPYNIDTGTLDMRSMEETIKGFYEKNKEFIFMSLQLPDYVGEGRTLPDIVKEQTRRFTVKYFRNGVLFQVSNGQIVMIASKGPNPDYEEWMKTILKAFQEQYEIHKIPFKIVYGDSLIDRIQYNEYVSFIDSVNNDINNCTMHRISYNDVAKYKNNEYIVKQLEDIYKKADLNDPRVLVYAQPVFNISTKRFDTAEALMRLKLDETGIVVPGLFIPIAEERGYIHVLTKIILNKTCQKIHELNEQGYNLQRISVNVSMIELKSKSFCDEVLDIINKNNIPGEMIAIELTESQNEADFMIMKEKIEMLHEKGIKFYLDDFGTGYSNMERIFELPFDIIKFDRSMVIASGVDERSEMIVKNLATMFENFKYSVLYEGVETSTDEDRCLSMAASYLQGFKYSQPIPIDELSRFLSNNSVRN